MYHPLVAIETGLSVETVFLARNKDLGLGTCLIPDIFTGLKGPEHQEKLISLYQRKLNKLYRATLICERFKYSIREIGKAIVFKASRMSGLDLEFGIKIMEIEVEGMLPSLNSNGMEINAHKISVT